VEEKKKMSTGREQCKHVGASVEKKKQNKKAV
jgi:hypothetical protein